MTDPVNAFAEAQQNLSDALFRLWMQPFQLTQAGLAAGSELIAKTSDSAPSDNTAATPDVVAAAEEKIAHLDEEMDQTVPEAAAVVV